MVNQTSRERVLRALSRREVDRAPFLEPVIAENVALELCVTRAGIELSRLAENAG
ncbi:MAG: hypothetical protein M1434_08135 [Chloroflexi bacterium]|nr:hypothetical protein [Chloroflexota bacterium]MCL5274699.1 hypothetical protein [Chloroflexota bacterium]